MKNSAVLFLIIFFSLTIFAQKSPKTLKKSPVKVAAAIVEKPGDEKDDFEKASALTDTAERAAALAKFVNNYPKSAEKVHAQELLVVARAQIGDQKLKNNEREEGIKSFKLAVNSAPQPMPDKLFNEIVLQIPISLFFRGEREAAVEIAQSIERKTAGNAKQLLGLASFYLNTENGLEAGRLADKAIALEPNLPAAYQVAGVANRLNFQLEDAVKSYAKALELDGGSAASKRSLADMNRAVGKPEESITLYREILTADAADVQAQTGLTLALFDAEKQPEAETEMAKSLARDAKNLPLLVGAAYWYAAHNNGAKAVELAGKAVALEPRYVWAQIALARGYAQQKRPLDAEHALLAAQQYGNFPTLSYELASARLQAGFFREAAETLKTDFTVEDNAITTKLGGRISKNSKSFTELLAPERRASILEPLAADNPENARQLKNLLVFVQNLDAANANESVISQAADSFIEGDDAMKLHRQLYVARRMLEKQKNSPKAFEITQAAIGKTDAALDAPNSVSAILANALYESRVTAASRNEFIIVPEVPRQTLSAILRGEIEDLAGWSLDQQNRPAEATVRLKRAISVLPEKTFWSRDAWWRLGATLAAGGKDKDALDAYIKSYPADTSDTVKYIVIEALYKKLNGGSTDGLEAKIGARPSMLNIAPIISNAETDAPKTASVSTSEAVSEQTKTEQTAAPADASAASLETSKETLPTPTKNLRNTSTATENLPKPEMSPEVSAKMPENLPVPPEETKSAVPPAEIKSQLAETKVETKDQTPEIKNEAASSAPVQAENKPVQQSFPAVNSPQENTANKLRPLFEPIIIQVPSPTKIKPAKPDDAEKKTDSSAENLNAPKTTDDVKSGISRPRSVVSGNDFAPTETPQCSLIVSQENVSLISDGGSVGILISFENPSEASEIKGVSSSPNDVEATLDAGSNSLSGRSLFIIKSISANVGEYKISFVAGCGKKEIAVKVR